MRVTCVLASAERMGAELAVETQLRLRPSWLEPSVVLMQDGPLAASINEMGVEVEVQPRGSRNLAERAQLLRSLARGLRRRRTDLIFAVGNKAVLLSLPAAALMRVPVVWYKVDLVMPGWQVPVVSGLCRRVIAMSAAAGSSVSTRRLRVVHPPVRLDAGFVVSERRPPAALTCLGRLEPTKGQHHLIEAAKLLHASFPEVNVVLAGKESAYARGYRDHLERLAERLGVPLQLLGHLDRIESLLEATTVYVQPSYRDAAGRGGEGFGIALAEASWAGLPVVASRTGGTPEVVQDGVTGTLVAPSDPRALAHAIGTYLGDPDRARVMGIAGSRRARSMFSPELASARLFEAMAESV